MDAVARFVPLGIHHITLALGAGIGAALAGFVASDESGVSVGVTRGTGWVEFKQSAP
jgi:hypothetical protein